MVFVNSTTIQQFIVQPQKWKKANIFVANLSKPGNVNGIFRRYFHVPTIKSE